VLGEEGFCVEYVAVEYPATAHLSFPFSQDIEVQTAVVCWRLCRGDEGIFACCGLAYEGSTACDSRLIDAFAEAKSPLERYIVFMVR
jgi:hypothetical protein